LNLEIVGVTLAIELRAWWSTSPQKVPLLRFNSASDQLVILSLFLYFLQYFQIFFFRWTLRWLLDSESCFDVDRGRTEVFVTLLPSLAGRRTSQQVVRNWHTI
jgi:hypothetical protein